MLCRRRILQLIPHQGTMCLLDEAVSWSDTTIACRSRSHLAADNPLRRDGELAALCGIEYGLQVAATHLDNRAGIGLGECDGDENQENAEQARNAKREVMRHDRNPGGGPGADRRIW